MTVAEELRAFDYVNRATYLALSDEAFRCVVGARCLFPSENSGWFTVDPFTRAEIMSEAIEAAEALGL